MPDSAAKADVTQTHVDIASWFATPLVMATLSDREDLNRELIELFLNKEKQGEQHRNPNKIGTQIGDLFESTFDLFKWSDPPVQRLASECHTVLRYLVREINNYTKEEMEKMAKAKTED